MKNRKSILLQTGHSDQPIFKVNKVTSKTYDITVTYELIGVIPCLDDEFVLNQSGTGSVQVFRIFSYLLPIRGIYGSFGFGIVI